MFDRILKEVILPNEGGYVNNPSDLGGATNFGITQTTFDKYRGNVPYKSVKYISTQEVNDIYFSFWTKARCDLIFEYVPALTVMHYDFLVNAGYQRKGIDAAEILQRTINSFTSTVVDGYIGPKTLSALIQYVRFVPLIADANLKGRYSELRNKYYNDIVSFNPSQAVFLRGWQNRIAKTNTWIYINILHPSNP